MVDMMIRITPLDETALRVAQDRRKVHIRNRESWQALQKHCGHADRELARFASDQAKDFLQWEKAATWIISFTFGTAPAFSPIDSPDGRWKQNDMPHELRQKILHEHACAEFVIPAEYIHREEKDAK
jgi:hypothetical protein